MVHGVAASLQPAQRLTCGAVAAGGRAPPDDHRCCKIRLQELALPAGCLRKHEEALLKGEHQALCRLDSLDSWLPPDVTASPQHRCKHSGSRKILLAAALNALLPHLDILRAA